jgi:MFS family permease
MQVRSPSSRTEDHAVANAAPLRLPAAIFGRPVFYGWYIVFVAFISTMMAAGVQTYTLGSFLKPMTEELGWSRTDISLGQTVSTVVGGFVGFAIGPLIDRRGGRELMVAGAVIGGMGFMALGLVQEVWHYYLVRGGLITVGTAGMGGLVVNIAVANWFVRMRGRAIAIGAMGLSLAALVLPVLSTWLIDHLGWRWSWVVIGASIWAIVIPISWLVMRRRPEDHGLEPDGGPGRLPSGAERPRVQEMTWTRQEAARTPALWLLIIGFGLSSMGMSAMLLHLIPYLSDEGFSPAQAAAGFGMIGVAGLISKPIWGLALERFPAKGCALAEFLLMAAGIALILQIDSELTMYPSIFLFGLGIGGVVTVQEVVWANFFGRLTLGTVRSVGRPFGIITSAAGPVFAGAAYDVRGSYEVAFLVFIAANLLAAALILLTPKPRSGTASGDAQVAAAAVATVS